MNLFMMAVPAVTLSELCRIVMRSEVANGERKRQSIGDSCANNSKRLIRGCASVPACQDCGRSAMDPSNWNHQQEPGVIDCVLGEHTLSPPLSLLRCPTMYLGHKRLLLRIPSSSQRRQSHRIVHLHVRSAVPQELPSLCGALPPTCELPRRRANDHLFSISSE